MVLKVERIVIAMLCLSIMLTSSPNETRLPENMVLITGGEFLMGSNKIPNDEEPVHNVTLNSFYIGKFEVTQAEWKAVIGKNPSLYRGDNLPVENVNWYDAVEFCNKKSNIEGLAPCYKGSGHQITCNFAANGYRLPTEAEWEYACQGGSKSRGCHYSGSNNPGEIAWYESNSGYKTQPVGQKQPNELGIYDMSGNVWEWCWDRYDKNYYKTSVSDNPKGPSTGESRSYRGGGSNSRKMWLRSHTRFNQAPEYKYFDLGFRLVKNASGKGKPPGGMVLVKGGTFKMGSSKGKNGEKSVHPITVSTFYIGKFEVTQEEWKAVMKKNPAHRKGSICPMHYIDWYEAVEYCNRRSRIERLTPCYAGKNDHITCNFEANGYRLPTEAEWEYAASGGLLSRHYKYSGSNDANEVAWYIENLVIFFQPVGQKKPNELGIYDMSGNVCEWCWDWYDFDYYKNSPETNPAGPMSGIRRVARGGGFVHPGKTLWNASRSCFKPYRKGMHIGFRVVRTAK
jgi:formylglycine-generating enzyme required for sulfatase activity